MDITQIQIRKRFDTGALRAVVSVTFDNQLAVHDIKVVERGDKTIIVMPNKFSEEKGYKDIVHPVCSEFRKTIERQILAYIFE